MADLEEMTPGQILADTNVATFIENLGLGIARAQRALDQNSLETAVALATERPEFSSRSLLELGFFPTFYHYQYADLEANLQITMRVERVTSVHVGLNAGFGYSNANTTTGNGTATITVNFGNGSPATAVLRLSQAGPAVLTVGATRVELLNGAATAPNVSIAPNSLRGTALALANVMSQTDPSDVVPEAIRATVEVVAGGTAIRTTTDDDRAFGAGDNRIEVLTTPAHPARAWVNIAGSGSINLVGSDTASWAASPQLAETAATAIRSTPSAGSPNYAARVLFQGGHSAENPHFAHNQAQNFEPTTEASRLDPWVDFLKANPTIRAKVIGHADRSGEDPRNNPLSRERAEYVRRRLVDAGVPESQLDPAEGRGEHQPVQGHDADGVRDVVNRRVELELLGDVQNVVLIETTRTGVTAVWGSGRPAFPSSSTGRLLAAIDGDDAAIFTDEKFVEVATHYFYVNNLPSSPRTPNHTLSIPPGTPAETAARTLAESILQNAQPSGAPLDAYAEGRIVHLLPSGSHALIRVESTTRNETANSLTLTASDPGSITVQSGFTGATAGGEPQAGDTIRLGSTTLTCRTGTAGANEFAKGTDANSTATSLAAAISRIAGFTGAAASARVTVTGPGGTAISASNTIAFTLSAAQLSGSASGGDPPSVERRSENVSVAAGLSLDVGYSRRFGVDITGNSRIATRLVSVPAPVELLDEIRTYLNGNPAPTAPRP